MSFLSRNEKLLSILEQVPFEKGFIKFATRRRLELGTAHNEAGTSQSVKTFGSWARFPLQNASHDLGKVWVFGQKHEDAAQVIAKDAVIAAGFAHKGGERCFL